MSMYSRCMYILGFCNKRLMETYLVHVNTCAVHARRRKEKISWITLLGLAPAGFVQPNQQIK